MGAGRTVVSMTYQQPPPGGPVSPTTKLAVLVRRSVGSCVEGDCNAIFTGYCGGDAEGVFLDVGLGVGLGRAQRGRMRTDVDVRMVHCAAPCWLALHSLPPSNLERRGVTAFGERTVTWGGG